MNIIKQMALSPYGPRMNASDASGFTEVLMRIANAFKPKQRNFPTDLIGICCQHNVTNNLQTSESIHHPSLLSWVEQSNYSVACGEGNPMPCDQGLPGNSGVNSGDYRPLHKNVRFEKFAVRNFSEYSKGGSFP